MDENAAVPFMHPQSPSIFIHGPRYCFRLSCELKLNMMGPGGTLFFVRRLNTSYLSNHCLLARSIGPLVFAAAVRCASFGPCPIADGGQWIDSGATARTIGRAALTRFIQSMLKSARASPFALLPDERRLAEQERRSVCRGGDRSRALLFADWEAAGCGTARPNHARTAGRCLPSTAQRPRFPPLGGTHGPHSVARSPQQAGRATTSSSSSPDRIHN